MIDCQFSIKVNQALYCNVLLFNTGKNAIYDIEMSQVLFIYALWRNSGAGYSGSSYEFDSHLGKIFLDNYPGFGVYSCDICVCKTRHIQSIGTFFKMIKKYWNLGIMKPNERYTCLRTSKGKAEIKILSVMCSIVLGWIQSKQRFSVSLLILKNGTKKFNLMLDYLFRFC